MIWFKSDCWDNASIERFSESFRTERMLKDGYEDIAEAKSIVTDYMFGYYQTVIPTLSTNT